MNLDDSMIHELQDLKDSQLYRTLKKVESAQSSRIVIDGREYINLSSNNYLGLADHPLLKEVSISAVRGYGTGAGASRLVSGNMKIHEELEAVTSKFKGTESALLFNSGYMANTGLIQAIAVDGDAIFSDELNHASIIDGCRLSRAVVHIFRHRDVEHLRSLLMQTVEKGTLSLKKMVVITESVFSMDGDIAPLNDMIKVVDEFGATLVVDDAHATGVLGRSGRGSFEHFGIASGSHVQMGTYSKALGSFGGYIAGTTTLRDYLINKSRPFIFTTALPPSVAAASIAAIKLIMENNAMLERLRENTHRFREGLKSIGFNTMDSETPIIPVLTGDINKTILLSNALLENGVYAIPVRPPTVPPGKCRLRTSVTSAHSTEDIEACVSVFAKVGRELGIV